MFDELNVDPHANGTAPDPLDTAPGDGDPGPPKG
jgi:hypothetical protein